MPIVLDEQKIIFFNMPKVASTSLKLAIYSIKTGETFRGEGPDRHIHAVLPDAGDPETALDAHPDYWSFTVVRDPVSRLLSAYANRVHDRKDHLRRRGKFLWRLRFRYWRRGLPTSPNVDTFFRNIDRYRALSKSIRRHTDPMRQFIGPDLGRIDAVYRIEDLPQLEADLRERTGAPVTFPREKETGTKVRFGDVSRETQKRVLDLTAEAYRCLDGLYSPPGMSAAA